MSLSPTLPKTLLCLIGLKGSGKSHIGSLLEKHWGIPFIRVEELWLSLSRETESRGEDFVAEGFRRQEELLLRELSQHPAACFESTGTTPQFAALLKRLSTHAQVFLVHVLADPDLCAKRVRSRDQSIHVDVSDSRVREINAEASRVTYPWALEIENGEGSDAMASARLIASRLALPRQP